MDNCGNFSNASIGYSKTVILWFINESEMQYNVPAIYFSGLMLLLGVTGNGFVVYVYGTKFKRTTANFFILWLAIFDLVSCLISIPHEMLTLRFPMFYGFDVSCKVFRFLSVTAYSCQILTLIWIAIDRFYKVCLPLRGLSNRNPNYHISIIVLIAVSVSWTSPCVYGKMSIPTCIPGLIGFTCSIADDANGTIFPGLYYGLQITLFCVSISIIFFLYCKIYKVIMEWKQKSFYSKTGSTPSSQYSQRTETCILQDVSEGQDKRYTKSRSIFKKEVYSIELKDRKRKNTLDTDINLNKLSTDNVCNVNNSTFKQHAQTTKTTIILFLVTLMFILSYLPYLAGEILIKTNVIVLVQLSSVGRKIMEIVAKSYCISNATNPLIYATTNPKFRKAVVSLFKQREPVS